MDDNQFELHIGTAKVDITPEFPVPLAGYTHFKHPFEGISERLYLRFLYLEQRENAQPVGRALLVSADLVWWGPERIPHLYRELKQRWGLESSSIIFHATHNHSGPQTSEVLGYGIADPAYISYLESQLFEGVRMAMQELEPVSVERGNGQCSLGIYRRKLIDGKIEFAPNEEGPTDPEVSVICFRSLNDNGIKAVLVHYACHPTTKASNIISSEFSGVAMNRIEESLGGEATALFLQGCSGDIRPAIIKDGRFYRGDERDIDRLATTLAHEVLSILQAPMERQPLGGWTARKAAVKLPFQYGSAQRLPDEDKHGILEMTLLTIAKDVSLLTMNAEISVEYGLRIKKKYRKTVLPVPYSNGMVGYVCTAGQIEEGGYEPAVSYANYGLPAPYGAEVEELIHSEVDRLIKQGSGI